MEAIIWLALMVIFLIAEAMTVTMVSLWFAAGAVVALLLSLLHLQIWLQVVLFLVVSGGLLAMLWPFVKKFLNPKLVKTNVDAIVESMGYVIADIDNMAATGQVKLNGMEWTARSTTGKPISAGTLVKVDRIEGVKAFVTPAEVSAEVH